MSILRYHRFVLFTTAALAMTTAAGAQGLENGDFEAPGVAGQPPAGWTVAKGKFMLDGARKNTGSFAGKLDGGEQSSAIHQDVPVTPGTNYQLSGFWRNGDRTADFDIITAEVRWLSGVGGKEIGQAATVDSGDVVGEWTPFQLPPVTAPPGAAAARIMIRSKFGIGAVDSLTWGAAGGAMAAAASPPSAPGSAPAANPAVAAPSSDTGIPPLSEVLSSTPRPVTSLPTASATGSSASQGAGTLQWSEDLRTARRTAAAEQKRILVFFTDEASASLEKTVFAQPAVVAAMANFIPVKLDFEKNKNLASALQVSKAGTVTIYDAKGEFLARLDAPFTAEAVVGKLNGLAK